MRRTIGIATTIAFAAAIAVTLHVTRPEHPSPGSDCEAIGGGLLRQPGNALSALGLIAAGLVLTAFPSRSRRLVGAGATIAGLASALAHATQHPVALAGDGVGVAVVIVSMVAALWTASRIDRHRMGAAMTVGAAGLVLWAFSRSGGRLCDPDALLGGHALWHLLAAAALLLGASSLSDEPRKI